MDPLGHETPISNFYALLRASSRSQGRQRFGTGLGLRVEGLGFRVPMQFWPYEIRNPFLRGTSIRKICGPFMPELNFQ